MSSREYTGIDKSPQSIHLFEFGRNPIPQRLQTAVITYVTYNGGDVDGVCDGTESEENEEQRSVMSLDSSAQHCRNRDRGGGGVSIILS